MRYYLIAGEASGDLHGSNLLKGLYKEDPQAKTRFWGGALMQSVWKEKDGDPEGGLVADYKDGAVMGFWEVLMKARSLAKKIERCKADILAWKPDVVILIDYPGFNFKMAEFAHGKGIRVFYYIAPKVWASRESRINKLKAYVDRLFIVFPFEEPYFQKKGVPYIYKGNPLIDAIDQSEALRETRAEFLEKTGLPDAKFVALLAGSRGNELSFMMPRLVEMAERMHALPQYASWHFLFAGAPSRTREDYEKYIGPDRPYIHVVFDQTYAILRHSEAAVIKSGKIALQSMTGGAEMAASCFFQGHGRTRGSRRGQLRDRAQFDRALPPGRGRSGGGTQSVTLHCRAALCARSPLQCELMVRFFKKNTTLLQLRYFQNASPKSVFL